MHNCFLYWIQEGSVLQINGQHEQHLSHLMVQGFFPLHSLTCSVCGHELSTCILQVMLHTEFLSEM